MLIIKIDTFLLVPIFCQSLFYELFTSSFVNHFSNNCNVTVIILDMKDIAMNRTHEIRLVPYFVGEIEILMFQVVISTLM